MTTFLKWTLIFGFSLPTLANAYYRPANPHYSYSQEDEAYAAQQRKYAPALEARAQAQENARRDARLALFIEAARQAGFPIASVKYGYVYRDDGIMCRYRFQQDGYYPEYYEGHISECADGSKGVDFGNCHEPDLEFRWNGYACADGHGNDEFFVTRYKH